MCFHVVMSCNFEFQSLREPEYKLYSTKYCGFARIHEIRARLLPYPYTMLDILLLPLLMHSPSFPPALCFRSLHSIDCFSDLLWPLAEYQELEKKVQSDLSCCPSPLVCCVPFLKYTALGFSISYPFHRATCSYLWKLLFSWLLWPRATNIYHCF